MEARVGIEPTIADLQSTALPFCYLAIVYLIQYFKRKCNDFMDIKLLPIINRCDRTSICILSGNTMSQIK